MEGQQLGALHRRRTALSQQLPAYHILVFLVLCQNLVRSLTAMRLRAILSKIEGHNVRQLADTVVSL